MARPPSTKKKSKKGKEKVSGIRICLFDVFVLSVLFVHSLDIFVMISL